MSGSERPISILISSFCLFFLLNLKTSHINLQKLKLHILNTEFSIFDVLSNDVQQHYCFEWLVCETLCSFGTDKAVFLRCYQKSQRSM